MPRRTTIRTSACVECGNRIDQIGRGAPQKRCSSACRRSAKKSKRSSTHYLPPLDRLLSKIRKTESCWIWTDYICKKTGYGQFHLDGRSIAAHRASYFLHRESVERCLQVDHLCRNRQCVNPDHLEPVTQQENIRRGARARTKIDQSRAIEMHRTGMSFRSIARVLGSTHAQVADAVRGRRAWVTPEDVPVKAQGNRLAERAAAEKPEREAGQEG